jgi:hypothetical protein
MTVSSRFKYGLTLEVFAKLLAEQYSLGDDLSLDAAVGMVRAFLAISRLRDEGLDMGFYGRSLVLTYLELAWRDLLYLRAKISNEELDESILTRYGRINAESEISLSVEQGHHGYVDGTTSGGKRDGYSGPKTRVRKRRIRKPSRPIVRPADG